MYQLNNRLWFDPKIIFLKNRHKILFWFLIVPYLLFSNFLPPVNCFICDQKCSCRQSSGKFTANCTNLQITFLPQCHQLDPETQTKLKQIQVISLNKNNFFKLQANAFHDSCLDNLQRIYLQQAQIHEIDDRAFNPLTNIIELSLAENHLRNIPSLALDHLMRLQNLDLSSNRIVEVANNSFKNLISLRKLSLNNNNISYIDVNSFAGLNSVQTIDLSSNRLTILKPESFVHLKSLHSLYLEGNDWNCNCRMQPFKRMLLYKSRIQIHDRPKCSHTSVVWSELALDHFQCAPRILRNFSETDVTVSEGSTLRLKCAIHVETFGDESIDREYLSLSQIYWYWNNVLITNDSKGCDHTCKNLGSTTHYHQSSQQQHFLIEETIDEYNATTTMKVSNLALFSVMTINEGNYRCSVVNNVGSDELFYHVYVIPYYSTNYYDHKLNNKPNHPVIPIASSQDSQISYKKNIMSNNDENADHVLFGLVLGILSGLFLVLVIFSIMFVFFVRKQKIISHPNTPQELVMIDSNSNSNNSNTDNNTVDLNETNTIQSEASTVRNASTQNEFNPLLIVNPVKKPPRLGIPDVSSIYSNPSWTLNRANHHHPHPNHSLNNHHHLNTLTPNNRSRYASYAETEPLYSDYHTLYRPNRLLNHHPNHPLRKLIMADNNTATTENTFISDTASEV